MILLIIIHCVIKRVRLVFPVSLSILLLQIMHFIMYSGVFNTFVLDQYSVLVGGYGFLKKKCLTAIFHPLAQIEI